MKPHYKPRNISAVLLSAHWLAISVYFIGQGTLVTLWIVFALVALCIGGAAVWVLLNDTDDR